MAAASDNEDAVCYDVAIIGLGPGGGLAARDCARYGLSTLVLEEDEVAGEPVHCGECVSAFALSNTGLQLPAHVDVHNVRGVQVIFPDGARKRLVEPGHVVDKAKFEQWLADEAAAAGAVIRTHSQVTALVRDGEHWQIQTKSGPYHARLLIDASGMRSIASELLQLNPPSEFIVGVQFEMGPELGTDGFLDFYLWPDVAPEGYLWVIPKSNGLSNVGLITSSRSDIRKRLNQFVARLGLEEYAIRKTFGSKIPSAGPHAHTVAEGVMFVGDAAGFTSPLFEGGTHMALKSGQMAAQVARDALQSNDLSASGLAAYVAAWQAQFPDYETILAGRRGLYNLNPKELWRFSRYIPEEMSEITKRDKLVCALKVLLCDPGLLGKDFIRIMRAFEYSRARFYGW